MAAVASMGSQGCGTPPTRPAPRAAIGRVRCPTQPAPGQPERAYLPKWPRFSRSEQWMSLAACETAESSDQPPAACSQAKDIASLNACHKLDLRVSILG
jgi:hypothetical protein